MGSTPSYEAHFMAQRVIAVAVTIISALLVLWLLIRIELNQTLLGSTQANAKKGSEESSSEAAAAAAAAANNNNNNNNEASGDTVETVRVRNRRLRGLDKAILIGTVAILALLVYLLLVMSGAPIWMSSIGILAVIGIFLRSQITAELRRQRFDRIVAILTLFLFMASSMCIANYAHKSIHEGSVYQGPARIVGYDDTQYTNKEGETTRTDLEVAWGGSWGCPETGNECRAFVSGAMCETENKNNNRYLEEDEDENNNENENENENENNDDAGMDDEVDDGLYEEDDSVYSYEYDDDFFDNAYWDYDWGSVWGNYACNDLFETDLEGLEYDASTEPGNDDWPFLNIYGKCKSCEAFIVDYYSTKSFKAMDAFKVKGRNYAIVGFMSLLLTVGLFVKYRMSPPKEAEIELLSSDGGAVLA